MQHEKYHSAPGSRVGTPAYLAPEVITAAHDATYDAKVHEHCHLHRFLKCRNGNGIADAHLLVTEELSNSR